MKFLAVNSSRGNKYYGECNVYSTKCLKPANKEAALDTETDKDRWAPPKQVFLLYFGTSILLMSICYPLSRSFWISDCCHSVWARKLLFSLNLFAVSYICIITKLNLCFMPLQHRGDIARALMYMAVCYGFRQPDGGPALHLSDSPKSCKFKGKKLNL